jgi:hypothetical protein
MALAVLSTTGCAGQQKGQSTRGPVAIARYYPLRVGSVWTYDVSTGDGLPVLAITRVVSQDGQRASVSSGAAPVLYEQRPEGLYRPDRQGYVLKAPLTIGTRWDAGEGVEAEVLRADFAVTTLAGSFEGCVEVREGGAGAAKQVRTVFCPDVGPVELESSLQMALTGKPARVTASLRGYDFSGALAGGTGAP